MTEIVAAFVSDLGKKVDMMTSLERSTSGERYWLSNFFVFLFTLGTVPRRSLSLKSSDTRVFGIEQLTLRQSG